MARLYEHTAVALAKMLRAREVSSREVVEAHLARIEAINHEVGAVTVVLRSAALATADALDRGPARGPLHGVPFSVKETLDCLGSPTTYGVRARENALPYADAPSVARMKAAGAVLIARTNTSEMALRLCTINPLHGRTQNPYGRQLTAGGSSGGDAAAVATGMVPLGIGTDMGGSLRVPAYCCGVATLKPTTGRIGHASSLEPMDLGLSPQLMLAVGPMARSVADLDLALSVMAGRDVRDPRSVDAPLRGPAPAVLRAALVKRLPGVNLPAQTVAAIERAGASLQEHGWEVEDAEPPELFRVSEVFGRLLANEISVLAPELGPFVSEPLFEHLLRLCRQAPLEQLSAHRLYIERSRLMRAWSSFLLEYPIVVGPTLGTPIWAPDADLDPITGIRRLEEAVRFLAPGNALGLPAVAVPMGVADGAPYGVQVYADSWREDLCLSAAELIESDVKMVSPIDPLPTHSAASAER